VLERACFTLGNLAYHESCKRAIIDNNGIPLGLEVARHHRSRGTLLLEACFFFSNMSVIAEGRSLIVKAGGVPFIVQAMHEHHQMTELLELACTALYNISIDPEGKKQILAEEVLPAIVNAMQNHMNSESFLIEAIGSIGRLFIDSKADMISLTKSGGIQLILKAASQHPKTHVSAVSYSILTYVAENAHNLNFQVIPKSHPTLKELCARTIMNFNIDTHSKSIPAELHQYLTTRISTCDHCKNHYIDTYYEVIVPEEIPGFPKKLPAYRRLCSLRCLAAVSNSVITAIFTESPTN